MALEEKDGFLIDPEREDCIHGVYPAKDCYSCVSIKEEAKKLKEKEEEEKDKDNG